MKFAKDNFTEEFETTIGVDFSKKIVEIENQIYKIQKFDTAGQERFKLINKEYYKNIACAMVEYDIANQESFKNVEKLVEDIRNESQKKVLIILVGKKNFLEEKREIRYDEGQEYAMENEFFL